MAACEVSVDAVGFIMSDIKKTIICTYEMEEYFDMAAKGSDESFLWHGFKVIPCPECRDDLAYAFNENGDITTIVIEK